MRCFSRCGRPFSFFKWNSIWSPYQLYLAERFAHFLVFTADGLQQMGHGHDVAVFRRQESRRQRRVLDVAAAQFELPRQECQVQVRGDRRGGGPDALPDALAVGFIWEREFAP